MTVGYLTYGAGVGIAAACGYVPMVAVVGGWFAQRRALAVGLSVAGIGVGTLVMSPLAARLIDSLGWRDTYRTFGVAGPIVLLVCAVLVERPPGSGAGAAPASGRRWPRRCSAGCTCRRWRSASACSCPSSSWCPTPRPTACPPCGRRCWWGCSAVRAWWPGRRSGG
ncbi:MAG: MFS transporter [Acidimicrobiales bacterium]